MKKKKIIIIVIVALVILMLIPIPMKLKDGGSTEYKAFLYKVTKVHRLNMQSSTGYEDGWEIHILGFQVYSKVDIYLKALNIGEESLIESKTKDVTLSVKEETLTNTGSTFIFKNSSNKNYGHGSSWEIETKKDGKWHKIDVVLNFNSMSFGLNAGEQKELNINWENSYGKLPKGTYRFVKHVDYEYQEGKYEDFYVYAEFEI